MKKRDLIATGVLLIALMVTLGGASAQTSLNYNLEWHVIGGGGEPVSSTNYIVDSTAGQQAASPSYSSSANYVVCAGYRCASSLTIDLFLPLGLKSYP
jgi:hypothetical protein